MNVVLKRVKEEDRPVVIDLANNSLTVRIDKDIEKSEPIDDLEALNALLNLAKPN